MRILLVTHFFPPGHLGGTEILTLDLAKQYTANGHDVQVICGESWETASDYKIRSVDDEYQGIAVQRWHFNWSKAPDVFRYLYDNPEVYQKFTDFLDQYQPDIIQITSCYTLSASVINAANEKNIPIILSATDFWFICSRNTLLRSDDTLCPIPEDPWDCARCLMEDTKFYQWSSRLLPLDLSSTILKAASKSHAITNQPGFRGMLGDWPERFLFLSQTIKRVDRVVTANKFLKNKLIGFGVSPNKISFSSYGLDTSWAKNFETKTASDKLRLGFIGQILPFKGPHLLMKAVKTLPEKYPILVKIYGNLGKTPGYAKQLRSLAGNDPRFEFLGTFDNSNMGKVLSEIDVLIVPSTWYDFPLVIPSALTTKTPVITTNLPGMNEQIQHEINGLLFERYDWQGLSHQIERLITENNLLGDLQKQIQPIKTTQEMTQEYLQIMHDLR